MPKQKKTNTGFLRNEARKAMLHDKCNRKLFTSSRMDYKKFMCCKDAFMSGYTHANYMGEVMHEVDSFDYGSAADLADTLDFFSIDADDGE